MSGRFARLVGVLMLCGMLLASPALVRADDVARHAVVGNDVFLEGEYLSVGISGAGSFGTSTSAPAGFHPTPYYDGRIGLSVDQDGFDTGNPPRTGDFFLPGTPEERFNVGYIVGGTTTVYTNAERMGKEGIVHQSVSDLSTGDVLQAQWVGLTPDGALNVTQVIRFRADQRFFRNTVTLQNVGAVPLQSVRYMRNVDPDQDKDISDTYFTTNEVTLQQPADGKALVRASGVVTGDSLFYYSADSRARVSTFGFSNTNPFDPEAYDQAGVYDDTTWVGPYGSVTEDQAISICADLGTLQPGATGTFVYYTSLDANFTDALEDIEKEVQKDGIAPVISLPEYGLDSRTIARTLPVIPVGAASCDLVADVTDNASGSIVRVAVDGQVVATKRQNGRSTYRVALHDGANTVEISAADDAGNNSVLRFIIDADQTAPALLLDSLPSSVTSSSLTVSGRVTDRSGVRSVLINGHEVPLFSDGLFSESITLARGSNEVVVEASDAYGNTVRREVSVVSSGGSAGTTRRPLLVVLTIGQRTMQVNGMSVAMDAAPLIRNGRTLLPVRVLVEQLGGTVSWDAKARTATVKLGDRAVVLTVGQNTASVNGRSMPIDASNPKVVPEIINGRTFLPLRFVGENLGLDLAWDAASQTISFTYWP